MNEFKGESIRESLNEIEIPSGTKERMLANIKLKASVQSGLDESSDRNPKKTGNLRSMNRKKWMLSMVACFAVIIIGAAVMSKIPGIRPPENNLEISNPFIIVDNADYFEKALGIAIDAPAGTENKKYSILDMKIADILFDFKEHNFTLRASTLTGDFSGLNGIEEKTDLIDSKNSAVLTEIRCGSDIYRKITWTDGRITFILSNTDGASDDEITTVYDTLKKQ